jgi:hypothetical protein
LLAGGALTALIIAVPIGAKTDGKDKVTGTIRWTDQTVVMDAQSGPSGEDARGSFSLTAPTLSLSGPVTELIVDGNKATACGTATASSSPGSSDARSSSTLSTPAMDPLLEQATGRRLSSC